MREGSESSRDGRYCDWERRMREEHVPDCLRGRHMRAREERREMGDSKAFRRNGGQDLTSESRVARLAKVFEGIDKEGTTSLTSKVEGTIGESAEHGLGDEGFERSIDRESGSKEVQSTVESIDAFFVDRWNGLDCQCERLRQWQDFRAVVPPVGLGREEVEAGDGKIETKR